MIEMMVKSLRDQSLKTVFGKYWLVEGEVKLVQFKNMNEFNSLVDMGVIKPVPKGAVESKEIPVIPMVQVPMKNGLPTALHDGDSLLELSSDPEDVPNEETIAAMEETDLEVAGSVEELIESLEEDDSEDGDWTSEIDHV